MKETINPWHDVEIGSKQPEIVQAIIEIPEGNKAKYELDKKSGLLRLDRVLYSSFHYPVNYGFIPQTLGEDNDPLDIIVLCQVPIQPLCIVEAKVIGVMNMIDNGEPDDKIIAIANNDMRLSSFESIDDISEHMKDEIKNFFEEYKKLEGKKVTVSSYQNKEIATKIITKSITAYNNKFKK